MHESEIRWEKSNKKLYTQGENYFRDYEYLYEN